MVQKSNGIQNIGLKQCSINIINSSYSEKKVFEQIKLPIFLVHYYKNEEEQNTTASIKRMKEMFTQVTSVDKNKY